MSAKIEVVESRLFAGVVADEIAASINEFVDETGRCSLVLAGGSTPALAYRALSCPPRVNEVPWKAVSLFWTDERWVPAEDNQSNFRMVHETLLAHLAPPGPAIHAMNTSLAWPQDGAGAYADDILSSGLPLENGLPIFDIVLLGMGSDGRIASVYPHSELIAREGVICEAVPATPEHGARVTVSPRVLFAAKRILFIVSGEKKAEIVRKVMEGDGDAEELPARLYEHCNERVTWFLDAAAARKLVPGGQL